MRARSSMSLSFTECVLVKMIPGDHRNSAENSRTLRLKYVYVDDVRRLPTHRNGNARNSCSRQGGRKGNVNLIEPRVRRLHSSVTRWKPDSLNADGRCADCCGIEPRSE